MLALRPFLCAEPSSAYFNSSLVGFCSVYRFLFILLGPKGKAKSYHEIGRAIATLMSDEVGTRYPSNPSEFTAFVPLLRKTGLDFCLFKLTHKDLPSSVFLPVVVQHLCSGTHRSLPGDTHHALTGLPHTSLPCRSPSLLRSSTTLPTRRRIGRTSWPVSTSSWMR